MGQEGSRRKRPAEIDRETLRQLQNLQKRTKFGDAEAKQLYEIFDDAAGEKRALNRRDFQKALGALENYGLAKFKDLPMGHQLFECFDANGDGLLDAEEFFLGLSRLCKGTDEDRIELTFSVFDRDRNGYVSRDELKDMYISTYRALINALRVTLTPPEFVDNAEANKFQDELVKNLQEKFVVIMEDVSKNIMREMDKDEDGKLTKDEFRDFVLAHPFVKASYQLKFTRDGGQPAYQDDEKLTAEVALSFLSPPPNAQIPNQPRALTEERKSKN